MDTWRNDLHPAAAGECDSECPVRRAAEVLDGKWTTQVVRELLPGKIRFSQLQRGLPDISPKMLTTRLKMLQSHGLVTKTIYPCIPPKTEYQLTALGREMELVIAAMAQFGVRLAEQQANNAT